MSYLNEVRFPNLPAPETGTPCHAPYESNPGTVTYGFTGMDAEATDSYRAALASCGLSRVAENRIADCTFTTWATAGLPSPLA